ncbi:TOG array regulator of axonemal microtubules protein 2 [Grus japonensis]|uniref:TOG array regulator of axonemal microtubules protein 2 n=1 Tax=Grus japonensis TaxID=30415 RepID=A0ABC9WQB4_GRUJA
MTTQDDFTAGKGLQQTGADFFSQGMLQSHSRSLCLEDVRLQRQCWCPGMLLISGRQSMYKSCIQSADHETLEMLASAAAILHAVQSILTTQLKKQPSLWARHGAGKPPYPRTISPMEGRISKTSVHNLCTGDGDDLSHLSHRALSPDPQERRVSSAALETIPIKNKLKMRRMSEDLPASQRGLTDCSDPKEFTPKPVVSSSASQRLLVNSKPVPPIQNSLPSSETSRMSNGEQEHGENGTGCDDSDGSNEELMSEGKGYQASLLPCSGGDGKKSLRVDLIPPIPKSARPSHRAPGRAAVPLPSFQDLDFQEDLEMRPRSGSSSEEETLKHPGLPLSQAKEMDHLMSPPVMSDDDLEDSNGRIHITLSKSAQKKIQQKRMKEMELLHRQREKEREKEKSLQLPTQTVDPEDADKEMNSLPAIALDFLEWGDEAESGNAREARPFPYPQQELLNALTWLSSDNWEQKAKGLFSVRRLAICHSEVLLSRLHDVSLAVTKEVNNLRTKVSRFAIGTLGELFRTMKKHMDHEVDMIAQVLLQKMGDTSEFIQKGASRALAIMVGSVTPARAMTALMASGIQHRNALVRKCAAEHLLTVIERIGAEKLLAGTRASTEVLVHTLVKLAQDCHQDTRCYGRKMLNTLMSHQKFVKYLKQTFPSRDLEDVMATIKQKGIEDYKCEPPPAKDHGKSRKSNLTMAQDNLPSGGGLKSGSDMLTLPRQTVRRMSLPTAEESEQLKELCKLLTAKDFQSRVEGVALLLDHCKSSCRFISTNIVPIFDIFALRLQDCNKKVSQQALEALALMIPMLRGALHPVLVSLVAAVTENLNSKHLGIYAAAVKVLEASIAHLDSTMLLQAFAHRLHSLSGQALLDITERISVLVASVYPRKPQAAKRYALPTLWFFLGNSVLPVRSGNVRAVVAKLAKTLYEVMGSKLMEHAANQPQHVAKNLRNILDLNVG